MASHLLSFPAELLTAIVSQVDSRSDLLSLKITCHILYRLADRQLWRVLDLGTPASVLNTLQEMLMHPARRFHVREVRITQIPENRKTSSESPASSSLDTGSYPTRAAKDPRS